jgi:L-lactate dehydrogenase complex protein LldG
VAPVHIVIAKTNQILPDIGTALARAEERGTVAQNSFLCLITGSSRTADIEKILVMGAHGPRRLIVVLATS